MGKNNKNTGKGAKTLVVEQKEGEIVDIEFPMTHWPIAAIISVHINNLMNTPDLGPWNKKVILCNLYASYGVATTNSIVRSLFPAFYKEEIAA